MNVEVLYRLPEFFTATWNWASAVDGRIGFAFGFGVFAVLRVIFGVFANPLQKVIATVGVALVLLITLTAWIALSGTLEPGQLPFSKASETPNVDTLKEIRE